jgi:GntR family transcriptional repressor for pyruvate dehydrogenase complex
MDSEKIPLPKSIARRISSMIRNGELPTGTKLPSQRDLSTQFGVSRTAVREAISQLEASGALRTEPGRGMFVGRRPDASAPGGEAALERVTYSRFDLCQFRYMLEGQAARLAAMRLTDSDIEGLEVNLQKFKAQTRAKAMHDVARTDFEFHNTIVRLAGVQLFTDLHNAHRAMLIEMIEMPRSQLNRAWEPVVEHERILEALRRRDPDEARYYMQSHIVRSSERLGIMLADDIV